MLLQIKSYYEYVVHIEKSSVTHDIPAILVIICLSDTSTKSVDIIFRMCDVSDAWNTS